jgi:hypothetical protein
MVIDFRRAGSAVAIEAAEAPNPQLLRAYVERLERRVFLVAKRVPDIDP